MEYRSIQCVNNECEGKVGPCTFRSVVQTFIILYTNCLVIFFCNKDDKPCMECMQCMLHSNSPFNEPSLLVYSFSTHSHSNYV